MRARSVGTYVQIGEAAINMARVAWINFNPLGAESIRLHFSRRRGDISVTLRDDERLAFLDWWERQAGQSSVE